MTPVKLVPPMVWTRRSVAVSMTVALEEHRREIGQRLAALRESRGLTQDELAHQAGVSEKTVSRLENGRNDPELDTLRKFAKALKVELRDLQGEQPVPLGLGETQLDRIEKKLSELLDRLVADGVLQAVQTDAETKPPRQPSKRQTRAA